MQSGTSSRRSRLPARLWGKTPPQLSCLSWMVQHIFAGAKWMICLEMIQSGCLSSRSSDLMNGDTSVDRRWLEIAETCQTSNSRQTISCLKTFGSLFRIIKLNMIDFQMTRPEFYRLPQWKRNDLKKRVKLFWGAFALVSKIWDLIWTQPKQIWPTHRSEQIRPVLVVVEEHMSERDSSEFETSEFV